MRRGSAFGIAEADVEFEHFGALAGHHEAGIENAAEGATHALEGVDDGDGELVLRCERWSASVMRGVGQ